MLGLRLRLVALVVGAIVLAFVLLFIGINVGLRRDVGTLATQSVDAGADALSSAVAARTEQVRSTVLQAAGQGAVIAALQSHNTATLQSVASDTALSSNLSFVAVVDGSGHVLVSSRGGHGNLAKNALIQGALAQATVGGAALMSVDDLKALGLDPQQAQLVSIAATPVNDAGRTIGVVFGGQLFDSTMKSIDDVSKFTGGQAAIAVNGSAVASSIADKDGGKVVNFPIANSTPTGDTPIGFTGTQTYNGVEYFAKITPLTSYDGKAIGAYWFGVPYANFQAIVDHTLQQIALWGTIGGIIALALGTFAANRIGRQIIVRSREVNESANELKVLVVGGEVSGDHVDQTREKLEQIKALASNPNAEAASAQLHQLASEAVDDVIVIDTLSTELSGRMRDAAIRVERLSNVARELDELVAGARVSKN